MPVPQLVLVHLSVQGRRSSILLVQADVIGWSELPANVGTEDYPLGRQGTVKQISNMQDATSLVKGNTKKSPRRQRM
eukprot:g279.t1